MEGKDWIKISHEHDALVDLEKMLILARNANSDLYDIMCQQREIPALRDDKDLKKMIEEIDIKVTLLSDYLKVKRAEVQDVFFTLLEYDYTE